MQADLNTRFATAENFFGNGSVESSDDWIDIRAAQDNGSGNAPVVEVLITTAFTGGSSVAWRLAAVDSNGNNPVIIDQTPFIPVADLVVGARFFLRLSPKQSLPSATLTCLRMQASNTGNNTAGAATIQLVPEGAAARPAKAYPSGY